MSVSASVSVFGPNKRLAERLAFGHLFRKPANKFTVKRVGRVPGRSSGFVQLKDRIRQFNFVKGDRVRITVGAPKDKFNDAEIGLASGYKVYTVADVNMTKNRIYLEGLTNKKANIPRPLPDDFDELSPEAQREWSDQKNWVATQRPVQYSNVQLVVDESGDEPVFASRIAVSRPRFDRELNKFTWDRYAAKLTGPTTLRPEQGAKMITIPWPEKEEPKVEAPTKQDTLKSEAQRVTLTVAAPNQLPAPLVPTSVRAPPPANQAWADEYVFRPEVRKTPLLQATMPFYLSEELSPRFSRAKRQSGWTQRREVEEEARAAAIKKAVDDWEAQGRDKGIAKLLSTDWVGLDGVQIRPRTRAEIRDAAAWAFDQEIRLAKRQMKHIHAKGQVYDFDNHVFVEGEKGIKAAAKKSRKERKARKVLEKLEKLKLGEAKNQVVPPDVRL